VLPLFPGVARVAPRDLPLPFHRQAGLAAQAARCAGDQNRYWAYHDLLYAHRSGLDAASLRGTAGLAALDTARFAECLNSGRHAAAVAADADIAHRVGVDAVPAVFVNGRYLSPPVSAADLIWRIDSELQARHLDSPRHVAARRPSDLPIVVTTVLHSAIPGQGVALLTPAGSDDPRLYREGDAIAPELLLRRVTARGVDLLHDEGIEALALDMNPVLPETTSSLDGSGDVVTPHRAVPVTLDRDRVLVLLSDRIGLEAALEPAPMTAGGHRLLKITNVAVGSLYELLGLEPGDVLLGVNEQPVHEGGNPLWNDLEREDEVRLRVMRPGGLARHFTYRFSD
jgi:hypothetical protein